MNKTIAILGATGSVGVQAQDVARKRGYKVALMSAQKNVSAAESAAREFLPKIFVMTDKRAASELATRLSDTSVKVYGGADAVTSAIEFAECDTVVNAILGEAGLAPSIAAIKSGHRLALANKESLVIAGDIVMGLAKECGTEIIPVDSEHSALFQSLKGGRTEEIRRIILTASGGPFFGRTRRELSSVTLEETLAHPTWKMGKKITVDSATLMNKGFEIIEAAHLFSVPSEKIEVVVHRESILHSAVEYIDNAIIGEFSLPDMRMCVQYAVDYPDRMACDGEPLDLTRLGALHFERPRYEDFPLLSLAKDMIRAGGALPAVMNAADEVAVSAFLEGRIGFTDIAEVVSSTCQALDDAKSTTDLSGILEADRAARRVAGERVADI